MKLFKYNRKTKRTIIVLMVINMLAIFTNEFNIAPKITTDQRRFFASESWYFIFTDGNPYEKYGYQSEKCDGEKQSKFWPFVRYSQEDGTNSSIIMGCFKAKYFYRTAFRGLFPDYDWTEFIVYSLLIFGIPVLHKVW